MMFTLANLTAINKASSNALKNIGTTDLNQKARTAFTGINNYVNTVPKASYSTAPQAGTLGALRYANTTFSPQSQEQALLQWVTQWVQSNTQTLGSFKNPTSDLVYLP
ncbi:MAG: hypothetical protein HEQ32_01710 [Vampirovibrio sp.]|jgi:hypothetical protein